MLAAGSSSSPLYPLPRQLLPDSAGCAPCWPVQVVQQVLAAAGPEAEASQALSLPELAALVPEADLDHKFTVDV
jgi:hypothetical protein